MPLPDVGDRGREPIDVGGDLPLAGPVQGVRTASGEGLGGEHHALRRQRLAHRGDGEGRLDRNFGLRDHEGIGDHIVEVHGVVPPAQALDGELRLGPASTSTVTKPQSSVVISNSS